MRSHVAVERVGPLERLVAALPGAVQGPLVAVNLLVGDEALPESKALPTALIRADVSPLVLLHVAAHERLAAEVHATAFEGTLVGADAPAIIAETPSEFMKRTSKRDV